jgi:DNA-binding transcriptional LysR family regulator
MAFNELRSIATFAKAAELGSLRQAAAAQGISPQAASLALSQLERLLGVRLFHRTTRVLSLTDAGQRFLEEAQPALMGLERAFQSAKSAKEEIAGPLRIVGPRTAFQHILWRLLDEFCGKYPDVQPDVVLEDRVGNWVEDRVDVGFRLGPSPHEGVIARRLFPLQLIVCGTREYFARHGAPKTIADIAAHRCIAFRSPATGKVVPWRLRVGDQPVDQPVVPAIYTNDEVVELHAVLSGQVLGQLAGVTAAPYIRGGQLVPVLLDHVPDYAGYFVYFGSRTSQPVRARAFIELAVERLTGNAEYVLSAKELAAASKGLRQPTQARR